MPLAFGWSKSISQIRQLILRTPLSPPQQKHYRKRRCVICDARPGQYVAIRDPLGDETRGVYCEFCHFQLHYDKDGHLLHDDGFEVFPYLHDD